MKTLFRNALIALKWIFMVNDVRALNRPIENILPHNDIAPTAPRIWLPSWITGLKGRRPIIGRRCRPQVEFPGFQELGQDLSQSLPWGKIANVRKWKDPSAQPFLFNMIHPHSWRVLTLVSRKQTAVSLSDSTLPHSALEPTPLKRFLA